MLESGVDKENTIRSQTSGEGKYYLRLDEVQLLDCFESVLNGYLRKLFLNDSQQKEKRYQNIFLTRVLFCIWCNNMLNGTKA